MVERVSMPMDGRSWEKLKIEMKEMARDDLDWRRGRHAAYVWHASEEVEHVAREAYGMFMNENGLNTRAFPSLRRMESEVVGMVLDLLNGGQLAAGHMTSGGTESIFLAIKAARDWARKYKSAVEHPEIVAPFSAHPSLNKAAHYLAMKVTRVSTGPDFRADVSALSQAVGPNTIMVYASAPAYSIGVIDPIGQIGQLAEERDLWFHVDACVGGVLGPFIRDLDYQVPRFDFSLPGVSSISADLHKSGYTGKGASTVLFRNQDLQEFTGFSFENWPTGQYATLNFTGTRPGGTIAAAWAVMNFLGRRGYLEIAKTVMETRRRFEDGLLQIDGMHLWGNPELWAVAYGSRTDDIVKIAEFLAEEGWGISPVKEPPGIHLMITPIHATFMDEYLSVLQKVVLSIRSGANLSANTKEIRYS